MPKFTESLAALRSLSDLWLEVDSPLYDLQELIYSVSLLTRLTSLQLVDPSGTWTPKESPSSTLKMLSSLQRLETFALIHFKFGFSDLSAAFPKLRHVMISQAHQFLSDPESSILESEYLAQFAHRVVLCIAPLGASLISFAVSSRRFDLAEWMLANKHRNASFDPNFRFSPTAPLPLCQAPSLKFTRLLVENGADVNAPIFDRLGSPTVTPLSKAVQVDSILSSELTVPFLLSRGARPTLLSLSPLLAGASVTCPISPQLERLPEGKLLRAFTDIDVSKFLLRHLVDLSTMRKADQVVHSKFALIFGNLGDDVSRIIQCYRDPDTLLTPLHLLAAHPDRAAFCDLFKLENLEMNLPDATGVTPLWSIVAGESSSSVFCKWPLTPESNARPIGNISILAKSILAAASTAAPDRASKLAAAFCGFPSQILVEDSSILFALRGDLPAMNLCLQYRLSSDDPGPDFTRTSTVGEENPLVLVLRSAPLSNECREWMICIGKCILDRGISPLSRAKSDSSAALFTTPDFGIFKELLGGFAPTFPEGTLHFCILHNDIERLEWLLQRGANANELNGAGISPIGTLIDGLDVSAALTTRDFVERLRLLVEHGANCGDSRGFFLDRILGRPQLDCVVHEILRLVSAAGASASDVPPELNPVIDYFSREVISPTWLSSVLTFFPELATRRNKSGATPMSVACSILRVGMILPAPRDPEGLVFRRTPAQILPFLSLLLVHGASVVEMIPGDRFAAVRNSMTPLVSLICASDASWIDSLCKIADRTPIMFALELDPAKYGTGPLKTVIDCGCNVNFISKTSLGATFGTRLEHPIVAAVIQGDSNRVELLLRSGADVTVCSSRGETLWQLSKGKVSKMLFPLLDTAQTKFDANPDTFQLIVSFLGFTCSMRLSLCSSSLLTFIPETFTALDFSPECCAFSVWPPAEQSESGLSSYHRFTRLTSLVEPDLARSQHTLPKYAGRFPRVLFSRSHRFSGLRVLTGLRVLSCSVPELALARSSFLEALSSLSGLQELTLTLTHSDFDQHEICGALSALVHLRFLHVSSLLLAEDMISPADESALQLLKPLQQMETFAFPALEIEISTRLVLPKATVCHGSCPWQFTPSVAGTPTRCCRADKCPRQLLALIWLARALPGVSWWSNTERIYLDRLL